MTKEQEVFEEKDKDVIEKAQNYIDERYTIKDQKEKRGYNKDHFYGGGKSKKKS